MFPFVSPMFAKGNSPLFVPTFIDNFQRGTHGDTNTNYTSGSVNGPMMLNDVYGSNIVASSYDQNAYGTYSFTGLTYKGVIASSANPYVAAVVSDVSGGTASGIRLFAGAYDYQGVNLRIVGTTWYLSNWYNNVNSSVSNTGTTSGTGPGGTIKRYIWKASDGKIYAGYINSSGVLITVVGPVTPGVTMPSNCQGGMTGGFVSAPDHYFDDFEFGTIGF